ncbi:MAG: hypothetical protein R3F20_14110 [Planctomycetota bacterium]
MTINTPFGGPRRGLVGLGRALDLLLEGRAGDEELAFLSRGCREREALVERLAAAPFPILAVAARDDEFVSRGSATRVGEPLVDPAWRNHTGPLVREGQRRALVEALSARLA